MIFRCLYGMHVFVVTCCGVLFSISVDDTPLRISSNVAIEEAHHRHRCRRRVVDRRLRSKFSPSGFGDGKMSRPEGGFKHQSNESVDI